MTLTRKIVNDKWMKPIKLIKWRPWIHVTHAWRASTTADLPWTYERIEGLRIHSLRQRWRFPVDDASHYFKFRLQPVNGELGDGQFHEAHAQRPDISPDVIGRRVEPLWRHVANATRLSGVSDRIFELSTDSKVTQLYIATVTEQHVRGFDICWVTMSVNYGGLCLIGNKNTESERLLSHRNREQKLLIGDNN